MEVLVVLDTLLLDSSQWGARRGGVWCWRARCVKTVEFLVMLDVGNLVLLDSLHSSYKMNVNQYFILCSLLIIYCSLWHCTKDTHAMLIVARS